MNKTAIKNFAIWARNKLIADITYKAGLLGITDKVIKEPLPQSTKDVQFFDIGTKEPYSISGEEIKQRDKLVELIISKSNPTDYSTAYKSVVEEVAYTWFNRLIAIRFMEVNDYLPSRIRVLSSESKTKIEPDLVTRPFASDLEFIPFEKDRIVQLTQENKLDELFRMLFIKQCNVLNEVLPNLFEKTSDYTELLLNVSFTDKDSVIYHLVRDIEEDDFNVSKEGQVEIIGWLYQFYNTEPKDEAFTLLKKNVKLTKERIPAATQLFTPDWIVRYMVENSLGRLWLDGHPNDYLKSEWKYYLEEAVQETDIQEQLELIKLGYVTINPEDIRVIDPFMGSGHILVYAFDVLMQIYESCGYNKRDAAKSIVEKNLYGLDIDNRAYQLAYFAVMMKARQHNRRIFSGKLECHIHAIKESNDINLNHLKYFGVGMDELERNSAVLQIQDLIETFTDAKEYGSILNVENCNWKLLKQFLESNDSEGQITLDSIGVGYTKEQLLILLEIGSIMARKYNVVVTNPPYMGSSSMGVKLSDYVKCNYSDYKADMFSVSTKKCFEFLDNNGLFSQITQPSILFLGAFEYLRNEIIKKAHICNLLHMGRGIFGVDFGSTSFVLRKHESNNYCGKFFRLHKNNFQFIESEDICDIFLAAKQNEVQVFDFSLYGKSNDGENLFSRDNDKLKIVYCFDQNEFARIPGIPWAYWVSNEFIDNLVKGISVNNISDFTGSQHITANNDKYLRMLWEVDKNEIENNKWKLYAKGGGFKKWYGNLDTIVNWSPDAIRYYKENKTSNLLNERYWNQEGITYTEISSSSNTFRYLPPNCIFDKKGPSIVRIENLKYCLAALNSPVATAYFKVFNPSISTQVKDVKNFPIIIDERWKATIEEIVGENIVLSKADWDSYETSWEFKIHPLIKDYVQSRSLKLCEIYSDWVKFSEGTFDKIKSNEEELNRIFIEIYNLQNEMTPLVEDKLVTVSKPDLGRDIRSFISYVVGCILGRFSLDYEGLVYAGGKWDDTKYRKVIPVKDNILPITDEEYFEEDIVGLLINFLKKIYGDETLDENLDFIAKALGNKGNTSREIIRNYFVKDFFKDHCKVYQKRPIYWLFDSGKTDGFKALVYMHRYDENTIGNLRIDYLHKMQRVYDNEINRMQETIDNSSDGREVSAAQKRKEKLIKQLKETKEYDEKIAHLALSRISIDLDDGVIVNYEKIQTDSDDKNLDVLAKI